MEVQVDVLAEKPASGERQACCEAFLTFVALGPAGGPARAPLLLPQTEEEERRARDAASRRSARLARRASTSR
jgi:acyl-CoA hydrolase